MAADRERILEEERNRLQAADTAKNEFLSGLSHELRTPLVAILGYSELLIRRLTGKIADGELENIRTIERNGKRLNAQIMDLLDLSRIQTKQIVITPEWVEWRSFLADIERSIGPLLDSTGHRMVIEIKHEDVWLKIDPARINQVVSNLIGNAAKYSPDAIDIEVVSEVESDEVVLSVKDYGSGIKPQDQQNLFTLFYRTQDAIESAVPGTGIGLFIAKKIVELHQGKLSIDSEYRVGTTARLALGPPSAEPPAVSPAVRVFRNQFNQMSA